MPLAVEVELCYDNYLQVLSKIRRFVICADGGVGIRWLPVRWW
jgi:hypothetical protein